MRWLLVALLIVFYLSWSPPENKIRQIANGPEEQCERAQKILLRTLSPVPEAANRRFTMASPTRVDRLDKNSPTLAPLLHPMFHTKVLQKGPLDYSIVDNEGFNRLDQATRGKGFWILYTPADGSNRNPIGHTSTSINGTYFTGQYAMASLGGVGARLDDHPYVMAQFFEVSDKSNQVLDKFYNDRTYFYAQGNPEYASNYVVLPHSRDLGVENGENCTSFPFSFLEPKWIARRPELQQAANDMGYMEVSELPNKLVFTDTLSPAYRGSVLVVHDRGGAIDWITKGDFNSSQAGHQLLFSGRPQIIPNGAKAQGLGN